SETWNRKMIADRLRAVLDQVRVEVRQASQGAPPSVADLAERIVRLVVQGEPASLRPVINATGILIHPELGPPPLANAALQAIAAVGRDYASVGQDLPSGYSAPRAHAV